ncbi:hypothetical protein EDD86DRAFT_523 [Gorgonomyces haynaldii]|nr:hypothetical protein EDD86DRAFT_523 [Gorgonomyces haynaldii]
MPKQFSVSLLSRYYRGFGAERMNRPVSRCPKHVSSHTMMMNELDRGTFINQKLKGILTACRVDLVSTHFTTFVAKLDWFEYISYFDANMSLPCEIWFHILLFCENPIPLSLTQRSVYYLWKSPVGKAKWLVQRYSLDEAILGALWVWNSNPVWRSWLQEASKQQRFSETKRSKLSEDMKSRNILEAFKPCRRCRGTQIQTHARAESMRSRVEEIQEPLKHYTMRDFESIDCPIEQLQWQVLVILFDYGADAHTHGNFLIRFAAMSGHAALLGLILKRMGYIANTEQVENVQDTSDPEAPRVSRHVLRLLRDSIDKKNIMMVYQCIRTGILMQATDDDIHGLIHRALKSGDLNAMTLLLDAGPPPTPIVTIEALQYVSACKWVGFDRDKRYTRMARFLFFKMDLDHLEEHHRAELLWRICELGDVTMASVCHQKNWNMDGFNHGNVLSAVLYGHYPLAKFLLLDCGCSPRIFGNGNIVVILIGLFNHLVLGFSLISCLTAMIDSMVCQYGFGLEGNIQMFFFATAESGWCGTTGNHDNSWSFYIIPILMFAGVYTLVARTMPLVPLVRGIALCLRQAHRTRRVQVQ